MRNERTVANVNKNQCFFIFSQRDEPFIKCETTLTMYIIAVDLSQFFSLDCNIFGLIPRNFG